MPWVGDSGDEFDRSRSPGEDWFGRPGWRPGVAGLGVSDCMQGASNGAIRFFAKFVLAGVSGARQEQETHKAPPKPAECEHLGGSKPCIYRRIATSRSSVITYPSIGRPLCSITFLQKTKHVAEAVVVIKLAMPLSLRLASPTQSARNGSSTPYLKFSRMNLSLIGAVRAPLCCLGSGDWN